MERSIARLMHCPLKYNATSECELTSTSPSFILKSLTHFNKRIYNFTYTHAFTLSTCIHFNIQNIPLFLFKRKLYTSLSNNPRHANLIQCSTYACMQILFNAPHMQACKSWMTHKTHASSFNAPTKNKTYVLHAPNHSIKKTYDLHHITP